MNTYSGTTPISLAQQGKVEEAVNMIMDSFHDLGLQAQLECIKEMYVHMSPLDAIKVEKEWLARQGGKK
jgi:hypothetical protein